jgi:hypothetical protein
MPNPTRLIVVLLILPWFFLSCGGSKNLLKEIPTTINTVKSGNGYKKKIAVALTQSPATALGRTTGELFFKTLVDAIRDEDSRSLLVYPGDAGYPEIMAKLSNLSSAPINAVALAEAGRQAGYQGMVTAAVKDIHVSARKTGLLWFRNTRYFIHYGVTVDLYDPYTAAKIVSKVIEAYTKISEDDYDAFKRGQASSFEDLNDEIENVAEDLGEIVGEALEAMKWKTTVVKVQQGRVFVPSGRQAGVGEGDRLVLFEGRRRLEGRQGERFIAPGYKLGEIRIVAVSEQMAEATVPNPVKVQVGDILIPAK